MRALPPPKNPTQADQQPVLQHIAALFTGSGFRPRPTLPWQQPQRFTPELKHCQPQAMQWHVPIVQQLLNTLHLMLCKKPADVAVKSDASPALGHMRRRATASCEQASWAD